MSKADSCPVCTTPETARERFAAAKVARHIDEKARRDDGHREWVEEHTEDGSLAEIRAALNCHGGPRE